MPESQPQTPENKSKAWMWVLGCGLAFVVGTALVCAGILFFGARWVEENAPDLVRDGLATAVDESPLSARDKQAIKGELDRLADAYKNDLIELEDFGQLLEELGDRGLFHVGMIYAFREEMLANPGLDEVDKQFGVGYCNRLARGVWDGVIPQSKVEDILNFSRKSGSGEFNWENRDQNWDDPQECRRILKAMTRAVDESYVPKDNYAIDIGQEVANIVDELLGY